MSYAIEFQDFSLAYGTLAVLENINLGIPVGACIAIIGPNGSGKTSLLKSMVGLNTPSAGTVRVLGHAPTRTWLRRHQIGYVPQIKAIDQEFPISVYEVVMLGRNAHIGYLRFPRKEDRLIVEDSLRRVNMLHLADRPIGHLSGGQQQRVFIARALAQESKILLLDEPASGLDIPTQQSIYELLDELHGGGITTVTTTHDLLALEFHRFDQVLCLNRRVIAFGPPAQVLIPETLSQTFSGLPWPVNLSYTR